MPAARGAARRLPAPSDAARPVTATAFGCVRLCAPPNSLSPERGQRACNMGTVICVLLHILRQSGLVSYAICCSVSVGGRSPCVARSDRRHNACLADSHAAHARYAGQNPPAMPCLRLNMFRHDGEPGAVVAARRRPAAAVAAEAHHPWRPRRERRGRRQWSHQLRGGPRARCRRRQP